MNLNLTANGKPQELILAYLQDNVSDILAEKINNGVYIKKDGKRLLSKKTLDGFMTFASGEAQKLKEKNARSACVEDSVVYGWAIYYFEEDTIEGTLYNEDGTEYKPVTKTAPKVTAKPTPKEPPKQQQASLFDMLSPSAKGTKSEQTDDYEPAEEADDEDEGEELNNEYTPEELVEEENEEPIGKMLIDEETGEVLSVKEMQKFDGDMEEPKMSFTQTETPDDDDDDFPPIDTKAFDPEALSILDELFGNTMILR